MFNCNELLQYSSFVTSDKTINVYLCVYDVDNAIMDAVFFFQKFMMMSLDLFSYLQELEVGVRHKKMCD